MDTPGYLSTEQVRQALREIYRRDGETNLRTGLLEAFSDELRPIDQKGRRRLSPLLVICVLLLSALVGVFAYFSIGGRG
jgi:hypothetical protein